MDWRILDLLIIRPFASYLADLSMLYNESNFTVLLYYSITFKVLSVRVILPNDLRWIAYV